MEENLIISKNVFNSSKWNEEQLPILMSSFFSIFMGRHSGQNNYTLGFTDTELIANHNKFGNLLAEFVPVKIEFSPEESFSLSITKLIEQFGKTIKAKTFVKDIFLRHPELHHLIKNGVETVYPVSIVIIDDQTTI